jgi:hypothetical protein
VRSSTILSLVLVVAPTGCGQDAATASSGAGPEGGGAGAEIMFEAGVLPDAPVASMETGAPAFDAMGDTAEPIDGSGDAPGPLLGWFTGAGRNDHTVIDAAAAAGANLVVAYAGKDITPGAVRTFLDQLQSVHMRALVQIDPGWVTAPDTAAIAAYVAAITSHPGLYGWYLFDEPEFNGVTPAQLKVAYDALRGADSNHPVAISFGNGYCSYADKQAPAAPNGATFMTLPEIVMFQQYPVHAQAEFQKTPDGKHALTDIAQMVDDCTQYLAAHHSPKFEGFISDLQAFAWSNTERDPTYAELRYMLFRSLIRSPFGSQYWVEYRASATLADEGNRLIREASGIGAALRSSKFGDPSLTVSATGVRYAYGGAAGKTYLVAVSDSDAAVSGASFSLPAGSGAKKATLRFDRLSQGQYATRELALAPDAAGRPTFKDDFTSFEVHIYELAP